MSPEPHLPHTHRRACAAVLLGASLALAGCSADADDSAAEPSPPSTIAPPATPTPSETDGSGARGLPSTVTGEVTAVDGECVYVTVEGTEEVLALRGGELPSTATGDTLTIEGAPDDTPYQECPEGSPFLVSEVSTPQ